MSDKLNGLLSELTERRNELVHLITPHSKDSLDELVRVQTAIIAVREAISEGVQETNPGKPQLFTT